MRMMITFVKLARDFCRWFRAGVLEVGGGLIEGGANVGGGIIEHGCLHPNTAIVRDW